MNAKTMKTTPNEPLRCIWIEQTHPMEDNVVIHHPHASLPTMEGSFIFAPITSNYVHFQ